MKHKKRKLPLRAEIVCALTLALVASMTVFFTANAAQGDAAVTPSDAVVAEGDDGTPDPDPEASPEGDSAEELETDTNPYGQPTVTVSFNRQIGDELPFWIEGSNVLIEYGDNSPVSFPGDRILRGNTVRIYGDVTYLKLPNDETERYNSDKDDWELITTPSGVTALDVSGAENLTSLTAQQPDQGTGSFPLTVRLSGQKQSLHDRREKKAGNFPSVRKRTEKRSARTVHRLQVICCAAVPS